MFAVVIKETVSNKSFSNFRRRRTGGFFILMITMQEKLKI